MKQRSSSFVSNIYTSKKKILDIWPRLGTSQSLLICSHQILLTPLFLEIRALKETLHGLCCATVAVCVVIICISPLVLVDFASAHPCKVIKLRQLYREYPPLSLSLTAVESLISPMMF